MRDPHVELLRYDVSGEGNINYAPDPEALKVHLDGWDIEIVKNTLFARPSLHFARAKDAQAVLSPLLRAWEFETDLRVGRGQIRFAFRDHETVDRDPPGPGEPQVIQVEAAELIVMSGTPTISITRNNYPDPPVDFEVTTDVEVLLNRYYRVLDGQEQFVTVHVGHDHVRQHQIDSARFDAAERFVPIPGRLHRTAPALDDLSKRGPDSKVVVDDQYRESLQLGIRSASAINYGLRS